MDRPDKTPISGIAQAAQPHAGPAFSSLASDVALRSEERRIYAPVSPKAVSGQCTSVRQYGRSPNFRYAEFAFADDVSWTDRHYTSDSDDSDFAARSPDELFYVVWVACENRSFLPKGCRHHNGVNDIRRFGYA